MGWKLKRTAQCEKCPWRVDVDPYDIPGGYCPQKHQGLASTITDANDPIGEALSVISGRQPIRIMACHETDDAHCVGWLHHQLGEGNNIALRMSMSDCENVGKLRVKGEQHRRFEDTLPEDM